MSNRLYVDAVQVRYLRKDASEGHELFGFLVGDDYDQYEVLDFNSEKDIPENLDGFLRHCLDEDHTAVWDLLGQHAAANKGVVFNGDYLEGTELKRILELLSTEEDEELSTEQTTT